MFNPVAKHNKYRAQRLPDSGKKGKYKTPRREKHRRPAKDDLQD